MSGSREHASFEQLNDLVDGRLDQVATARLSRHLDLCAKCRSEHERLQNLLSVASLASQSIDPPEDLWPNVRAEIESGKEVAFPLHGRAPGRSGMPPAGLRFWNRPAFLAAAAVVLIVLSSGITTLVLRGSGHAADSIVRTQMPEAGAQSMLPVAFRATEAEYDRTIEELRITVNAQRAKLNPETVRTIDRSLAVVDTAIAEARAALIADPNNQTLVDLLASSYQRKLDLLRRTSELSSKI